ncbi:signal recognition particle receptor subunit alpha [Mycolicibacterium insubricum]|uniref:signal recognition particle receptor subunit alpha n=1 Tax=Mycolicibacterium insubricum TaxID=444597 RepID=UPI002AE2CA86|nr:signal recognition particle receptor subunit alpha [Mycolicibacterium insubricum]
MPTQAWIAIAVVAVLIITVLIVGLVRYRSRTISLEPRPDTPIDRSGGYQAGTGFSFSEGTRDGATATLDPSGLPGVGDDAAVPRDAPKRTISDVRLPEPEVAEPVVETEVVEVAPVAPAPQLDTIAPTEGRLDRLRGRLAKSQNALGKSVLGLLGTGDLDEDSWQDIEDTLLIADLGPTVTAAVVDELRAKFAASGARTGAEARAVLREALIAQLHPEFDRSIRALPHAEDGALGRIAGNRGVVTDPGSPDGSRVAVAPSRVPSLKLKPVPAW